MLKYNICYILYEKFVTIIRQIIINNINVYKFNCKTLKIANETY